MFQRRNRPDFVDNFGRNQSLALNLWSGRQGRASPCHEVWQGVGRERQLPSPTAGYEPTAILDGRSPGVFDAESKVADFVGDKASLRREHAPGFEPQRAALLLQHPADNAKDRGGARLALGVLLLGMLGVLAALLGRMG